MPWRSAYTDAVLAARADYEDGLLPDLLEALAYEYAQMLDDVARDVGRGAITAERADALYLSIIDRMEEVTTRLGRTFDRVQLEAAQLGAAGHAEGFSAARAVAGSTLTQSFATVPQRAVELMIQRRPRGIASTFQALISRHLESMAGEVDRYLTSAVARGVSGQRGAVELAQILARNDPEVLDVLQRFNGSMARAIREGVPEDLVLRGRSLLQDTRRIMVTETNTAYFEADRVGALESPVVKLVRWRVSTRHYGLKSSPDVCDLYQDTDRAGFGPGLFHPANVPSRPHSYCACVLNSVLRPPEEWGQPKPDPREPVYVSAAETRRALLEAQERVRATGGRPRSLTDKYLSRQRETVNLYLRLADEAARVPA